ncbi:MAG: mechanosensitive ion channel [Gammaproteobacteria bacterium]|jgi:hypothetical protein|nr:mechanosensitive ion channel [Gammaproteobacteria bacterium]MBT4076728.1 mechanosensitive ion channel [Gammaproteobacteria bacterium]MBT4196250.1 mechanosensitive ion channel [Gammaproteobacteria bacterium]MBT4449511.1 mechanosensitive ion channel [Gammaproteobacteria bacterium]MBT4859319.1 mechanosensitive ion channel [Gammaproteobacteria bacterium]
MLNTQILKRYLKLTICCSFILFSSLSFAQQTEEDTDPAVTTIETLESFVTLKNRLQSDIKALNKQVDAAQSDQEKTDLRQQQSKLKEDLRNTTQHMREIAAGIDISSLQQKEEEAFNFQKEVFSLLKPAFDEMKEMTSQVRQKSELKENISFHSSRLPVIQQAIDNTETLRKQTKNKKLRKALNEIKKNWEKKQSLLQSELQANQLQLDKLLAAEIALAESSDNYLKTFFQKRGLYLVEVILVVFGIILLSKLTLNAMQKLLPGFKAEHRSFRIRLIELSHRVLTLFLLILGPMAVFYLVEDWVLFSLGILILLGVAWTLRQALPHYWQQIYIFLNIGSVREGERILISGLPWRVQKINMYCELVNPVAEICLRLPINDLVGQNSRPTESDEPWFPCKKNDWVLLNDGIRGKVTGISMEMVQLIERGGARKTYQTSDFLACSPRNLSTNFRIKETIGISYSLQQQSTGDILETLYQYIQQKIEQEGYTEQMLNLRVEFQSAGESSLDLVIIADFDGQIADLYNRLRRAIQRWSVDACTQNNWEIPFPQRTLHMVSEITEN